MPSEQKSSALKQVILALSVLLIVLAGLLGCNKREGGSIFYGGSGAGPKNVVTVFFSKYQGNRSIVEEVVRPLPPEARENALQFAVKELLKGPTPEEKSQGFYSEIPKGTQLLGIEKKPNALTINLSGQFAGGGGSNSMTQRFEELKQTVFSLDSGHRINISVEGRPLKLLGGEGLEVDASLQRDPQ